MRLFRQNCQPGQPFQSGRHEDARADGLRQPQCFGLGPIRWGQIPLRLYNLPQRNEYLREACIGLETAKQR